MPDDDQRDLLYQMMLMLMEMEPYIITGSEKILENMIAKVYINGVPAG